MPIQLTPSYSSLCRRLFCKVWTVKNLEAAKLPLGIRQRERGNIPRSTQPFDFILHKLLAKRNDKFVAILELNYITI